MYITVYTNLLMKFKCIGTISLCISDLRLNSTRYIYPIPKKNTVYEELYIYQDFIWKYTSTKT